MGINFLLKLKYSLFYVGSPSIINQEDNSNSQVKFDINYCIKKYEKSNIFNLVNSLDGSFLICFIDEYKSKILYLMIGWVCILFL